MIIIPDNGYIFRQLSIDNGSNTFGLSIVDLNIRTRELTVIDSETCTAAKTMKRYGYIGENHGERFARYRVLRDFLEMKLDMYNPDIVTIETPFMHRMPNAFATLREAMMMVIETVTDFDYRLEVCGVTPMEAKKAVGATKYDKGKEPIRQAVLALPDVFYANGIDPKTLDEHSIDSIAVAYFKAKEVLNAVYR
jgi:Holliday junction resolvasome RuvABC endonuclease subunit